MNERNGGPRAWTLDERRWKGRNKEEYTVNGRDGGMDRRAEREGGWKGTWKEQRVTMYQAVAPLACPAMVDRRFELDRAASALHHAFTRSQCPNEGR